MYADASFEPEVSQSGLCIYLHNQLVDWRSMKQPQVARSTAEAEVSALALGAIVLEGYEQLLQSLYCRHGVATLWGDNSASIFLGHGQGSWRSRAYANKAAGIKSSVRDGSLILQYVGTKEQRADGLTKALSVPLLAVSRQHYGLDRIA